MIGKQILTDIAVVLIFPLLLIWGFYSLNKEDGALLSLAAPAIATHEGVEAEQLGSKTKEALERLRSIPTELNQSLFSDPAYLMLRDYQVTIPTVPLGRPNPFTPPQVIENLSRASRASGGTSAQSVTVLTPGGKAADLKQAPTN